MLKTHECGEIRAEHAGESVVLAGWVNRRRDHGGVTFFDLRDRSGIVQTVANPEVSKPSHEAAAPVRGEWVIQVQGIVRKRPEGMENPDIATGEVEIEIRNLTVLNQAKTPPFPINEESEIEEMVRLRYRYMDLRRERMRSNVHLRHMVVKYIRDSLVEQGFWEIETPILFKATPEGARDYLVPSRLYPGEFYALPQSPQQLKQLLMVSGIEKYFQIARCFRDEDQRGDRQPEFTQLDLEMSFVEREDVIRIIEEIYTALVKELTPEKKIYSEPWPRLTYQEAMDRFGTDRPDIRFGMELVDISEFAEGSGFQVFEGAVEQGGQVRGINANGLGGSSRRELDELVDYAREQGAKGLAYLALGLEENERSSFAKFISSECKREILNRMQANPGDLLLFVADSPEIVSEVLSRLRVLLADRLAMRDKACLGFCWIIDFPFVTWNVEENRWDPSHHLFTAPNPEDVEFLDTDPGKARGQQYDLVINGYETAGGSIRIHDRQLQEKVFRLIGLDPEVARERFGHMLEAFEYGTPPHGGIASGIDRLCMILADEPNIREVIAFPKNQAARDVMADAPSLAEEVQLKELHLRIQKTKNTSDIADSN